MVPPPSILNVERIIIVLSSGIVAAVAGNGCTKRTRKAHERTARCIEGMYGNHMQKVKQRRWCGGGLLRLLLCYFQPSQLAAVMDSAIHNLRHNDRRLRLCYLELSRPPVAIGFTVKTDGEFVLNRPSTIQHSLHPLRPLCLLPRFFTAFHVADRGCVRVVLFVCSWCLGALVPWW